MNRLLWATLGAVATISTSQAVIWRDDTAEQVFLDYAADPKFNGIGIVNNTTNSSYGTASFIGRNGSTAWFLTANHVITNGNSGNFRFTPSGTSYSITAVHQILNADIAIFSVTGFTPTVNSYAFRKNEAMIVGELIHSAGVGRSGPQNWVTQASDQIKRGFDTVLHSTIATSTYTLSGTSYTNGLIVDRFDAPSDADVRTREGFGARGDSGSPYIDVNGLIMGVLSYGDPERYGGKNYYATINEPEHNEIVRLSGVPEPASMLALGAGVAALAAKRRRRTA